MVTFAQGYSQAKTDFQNLGTKLRDLNLKINYLTTDKRYGNLQSFMKICMWIILEINDFIPYTQGNTSKLMTMFNLNKSDSNQFAKSIDIFLRAAFLSLFMFQVEGLLKMNRNKMSNTSTSDKFYDISQDVLKLSHPKNWQQKLDVLRTPALIRNCLHTSGVHTKKNENVTVRGVVYTFKKNQMFKSASWDYLYIFMDELVTVLEEILTSKPVQKISFIKK